MKKFATASLRSEASLEFFPPLQENFSTGTPNFYNERIDMFISSLHNTNC